MKCLDLNEVVRETAELLEVSINKKVSLRIELHPALPGVSADPTDPPGADEPGDQCLRGDW